VTLSFLKQRNGFARKVQPESRMESAMMQAETTMLPDWLNDPGLFDNLTVPSHFADVYIAKYNAGGIIQWAKTAGGSLIDQANDVATDASGNSYVVGSIQTNNVNPTVTFDNITLTGHGSYDWFIAKYNAAGNLIWVKNEGSSLGDFAWGVCLDPSGDVVVCGEFSVISSGGADVFVAKYNTQGSLMWLKRGGGIGTDEAQSVVIDGAGNIALAGNFQNTATFGINSVTAAGLGDAVITKFDASGNNLWVRKGGGNISFVADKAYSITADGAQNFYITGEYTGTATFDNLSVTNTGASGTDIFIAKYNNSGTIQWLHHGGGTYDDKGYAIAADTSGDTFVTGFADSGPGVVFDTISLLPLGNEYIFFAKYNAAGDILYVKQYGAGSGQDIDVLNNGCLYFGGGVSKSNSGNEFDTIDLVYVDRNAFSGEFCDPIVPCAIPTGLMVNKITASSAKIHWDAVPGAQSYSVQYRKQGANNWKTKASSSANKKISNLLPSTTYEYHLATVCANGTSDYSPIQIFTTAPLKLSAVMEEALINVYPNPAHGTFRIKLNGLSDNVQVVIYDTNGKLLYIKQGTAMEEIDVNLPSSFHGLACIRVIDGAESVSKTILIQ
jgi:hypothetical protein